MKLKRGRSAVVLAPLAAGAVIIMLGTSPAHAATPIIYGSLGNFDVINDTGNPIGYSAMLDKVYSR